MANDKNTILICWNDDSSVKYVEDQIKKINRDTYSLDYNSLIPLGNQIGNQRYNANIKLCSNYLTLIKEIETDNQKNKIIGIIVLCELKWSHIKENGSYSDMNGYILIQHLRSKEKIKTPIVFVSFLSQSDIIAKYADALIINTPALKHEFIRLPSELSDWINKLKDINGRMTDLDLEYLIRRFCGIDGLIEKMNHETDGCSIESLKKNFEILTFAIEKKYTEFETDTNYHELKTKLNELPETTQMFRKLFKEIIINIMNSDSFRTTIGKQTNNNIEKKYHILYVDDDMENDNRINTLKSIINKGYKDFIYLVVEKKLDDRILRKGVRNGNKFDAIICDIEIWETKEGVKILNGLGFNYIKDLSNRGFDYIYIILSNATRSLHGTIQKNIPAIDLIRQKSEVLNSENSIVGFIEQIKYLIDTKKESQHKSWEIFKKFDNYFNNKLNDSLNDTLKFTLLGKQYNCRSLSDIENIIIQHLETRIVTWENKNADFKAATKEDEKNKIRLIIRAKLGFGGDFLDKEIKGNLLDEKYICNFVQKLIWRRFIIYLIEIKGMTLKDACSTISPDSGLYSTILHFPSSNVHNHYTKAEERYLESIKNKV